MSCSPKTHVDLERDTHFPGHNVGSNETCNGFKPDLEISPSNVDFLKWKSDWNSDFFNIELQNSFTVELF